MKAHEVQQPDESRARLLQDFPSTSATRARPGRLARALHPRLGARGVLVAVIAIALVATAAIVFLEHAAEQQHASEMLVVRIEELSQEMVALERLIERDGVVSSEVAEQAQTLQEEMTELQGALVHLDGNKAASERVAGTFRGYQVAVDELLRLLASGDFEAAHEWDEDQADPAHDALLEATAAASAAYAEDGRRARLEATFGSILTISLATLAMALLFWRAEHQRRAALVLASEQRALRASEQRFRALVQNTSDVVTILDERGVIGYQSPSAQWTLGYASRALEGTPMFELVHPEDRSAAEAHLAEAVRQPGTNITTELRLQEADGTWREFEAVATNLLAAPAVAGIVVTYHDVTERKGFEQQLKKLAFEDPLTGLPNRALFTDRLERALARADRRFRPIAVLFIDLDNFKVINDSLGHQAGDALLVQVAERLRCCVRTEDTVARLGGDEFTILLEEATAEEDALEVADRIGQVLERPFALEGRELVVSASIGIALSSPRQDRPEALIRNADLALYRAKSEGKARHAVFDRGLQLQAIERLELESDLRRALERGEFRVHYQPIVSLADGRIAEVEALVRWQRPGEGLVPPARFIPVAEETGLIVPLGRWVLSEACRHAVAWQARHGPLGMSVNLSGRQLQDPGLVADVRAVLAETGLAPADLKLEITESVAMHDAQATIITAQQLKALGVRLAIDDFGTGYSSLAYLKQFPLDTLKVDRAFVQGLAGSSQDAAIVRSVVALARTLQLSVTGEGVETSAQQLHLQELGVERAQGYLFGKPLPAEAVEALLAGQDRVPRAA